MVMEKQLDTQANYQDNHWLNIAETVAVAGSVGGTVASIFLKEMLLVSVPLSACVALNLINRKRLLSLITTQNNEAIATLSQHSQQDHANICDQMMQIQQSVSSDRDRYEIDHKNVSENIKQLDSSSQEQMQKLESQHKELASKVMKLAQNTTSDSPELYYQNANDYQQVGKKQQAIQEYTKAIKLDREYAEAYAERGALYTDIGNKQLAVEDLRKAAKLYFEKGDIDNYQELKQRTQDVYQVGSDSTSKNQQNSEEVLANSLFT